MDDYIGDDDTPCPKCSHELTRRSSCTDYRCDDGWIDDYEYDDPLWFDPGDGHACPECHGTGNLWWCPECGFDMHAQPANTGINPTALPRSDALRTNL